MTTGQIDLRRVQGIISRTSLQKTRADLMEFGIFNLMGYRYRESSAPAQRLVKEAAEQTQLADELGYDAAWFAEHHFSNYCICP